MWEQLLPGLRTKLFLTLLLGVVYPLAITGISQVIFPEQANGSLVTIGDKVIGSELIGQNFAKPEYFHPRPSSAGPDGYDATASGGSNYGPTNQKLVDRVKGDVAALQAENSGKPVPIDLVTTSGSGLDPHITPAGAEFQVPRVARARGTSEGDLLKLVQQQTEGRQFGFLGEPRVNVLELNLALDEKYPIRHSAQSQ